MLGVELWMKMLGADGPGSGLRCVRSEFRRDPDEGGGDLSRGDTGQCGVFSPDVPADVLCGRGILLAGSVTALGCSWWGVADDNARCIAAADGTVALLDEFGVWLGLMSWLLGRDLDLLIAEGGS